MRSSICVRKWGDLKCAPPHAADALLTGCRHSAYWYSLVLTAFFFYKIKMYNGRIFKTEKVATLQN